jgi:hypothetical protein
MQALIDKLKAQGDDAQQQLFVALTKQAKATAKMKMTFGSEQTLGGRTELARKVRELRKAGVKLIHYKFGSIKFRAMLGFEYVALWME